MRYQERVWVRDLVKHPLRIWLENEHYVVRDVTPDMVKHVLRHMVQLYAKGSTTFHCLGLAKYKSLMAEFRKNWKRQMLLHRVSLVLLKKGSPGADMQRVGGAYIPIVIGASIMDVSSRSDCVLPMTEVTDDLLLKKHLSAKITLTGAFDVFSEFGVDHVLESDGLSVDPKYQGNGLAQMLLLARLEMMRGLRIPLTKTMFVHPAAQKAAKRAGFSVVKNLPYPQVVDEDGNVIYPNLEHDAQLCIYMLSNV